MPKQLTCRKFAGAIIIATGAALIAAAPAAAGGGRLVPVHVSPPPNGGILVTHGNLHLPPPPPPAVRTFRDHRHGALRIGCGRDPSACAEGGVFGGPPAPPRGVRGGTVRDHRN